MDRVEIYLGGKMLARARTSRPRVHFLGLDYQNALEFAQEVYFVYQERLSRSNRSVGYHITSRELRERVWKRSG